MFLPKFSGHQILNQVSVHQTTANKIVWPNKHEIKFIEIIKNKSSLLWFPDGVFTVESIKDDLWVVILACWVEKSDGRKFAKLRENRIQWNVL